ncbi:MAG: MMPL family transporter [Halieaceae bacterium]|nr:MMPL family transporter [Halieaceae bacterium]
MVDAFYKRLLRQPWGVIGVFTLLLGLSLSQLPNLRLDASSDSLLLQGDPDLAYFRESSAKYQGSEFLVLTWEPDARLLSSDSLEPLAAMVDELRRIEGVAEVTTLLDVPLLESPPLTLTDLARADSMPTLRDSGVDRELALKELTTSPVYRNLLVSDEGDLTAVQVVIAGDEEAAALLEVRESLRAMALRGEITEPERLKLAHTEAAYDQALAKLASERDRMVKAVRGVAERFRPYARIFVGGVPMIAADMMAFVRSDLVTFGTAILSVMALVLALIFRHFKWVVIPLITCTATASFLLGVLAGTDWRMTVISSNSVAVLLIVTLSLSIHLVVRYRELHRLQPAATRISLAVDAARLMLVPCLYTAMTTIVAFASLVVAGLQPVIDFGWMMTTGIVLGFCTAFILVPALMVVIPDKALAGTPGPDSSLTQRFADVVQGHGTVVVVVTFLLAAISIAGIRALQVENRFIDYFKEHTEIYQGMELLDARLGGTIPLDVILLAPQEPEAEASAASHAETDGGWDDDDAFMDDGFGIDFSFDSEDTASAGYWFTVPGRKLIDDVHAMIEAREESGKVLSLSTAFEVMDGLYGGQLGGVELALIENSLPADVNRALISPFYSPENQEARISVRVMETSESLRRDAYLRELREQILTETGLEASRVRFTSLLVLYNNVLQSLFQSQIMTLGAVFTAIGLMFWALFRSLSIALLALAPNILAAGLVLGLMGLTGIPLDIMTITIAAIVVGIGVDDCIHYLHRFRDEVAIDQDYQAAMFRSHGSIGRAMYYTTLTVVVGFAMLTLSNFTPSLYFGVLTVVAMIAAVAGALLLLPKLILIFRPFGPGR